MAVVVAQASPQGARADSARDVQVAGRALTFLEGGTVDPLVIGVAFDASKPASVQEKNAIMAALDGGYKAGAVNLVGRSVEIGSVSSLGDVKAIFLTRGVNYAAISALARSRRIITIGSDPVCVRSGACVMGVTTEPAVQIVINRAAAAAVGAAFKAAFRMMIREI